MATYRVELTSHAEQQFRKLARAIQLRLAAAIDELAENPRPASAKHLHGPDDVWRIRVGAYRVVYRIEDDVLVVLVLTLGHRRDIYN